MSLPSYPSTLTSDAMSSSKDTTLELVLLRKSKCKFCVAGLTAINHLYFLFYVKYPSETREGSFSFNSVPIYF